MIKPKRTFYRLIDNHKEKVDYVYEYRWYSERQGYQRFFLVKESTPYGSYTIIDSHSGAVVIRDLGSLSKRNFEKICNFVLSVTNVTAEQKRFARVSKLKTYKGELS